MEKEKMNRRKKLTRNFSTTTNPYYNPMGLAPPKKFSSLPNIAISCPALVQIAVVKPSSSSGGSSRPKILKKTWDKVKTIIHPHHHHHHPQQPKNKRATTPQCSSSAPSTPLLQDHQFEFEDQQHRIVRNYELLQKRLSDELHQRMTECTSKDYKLDGLSDEFRKRLIDWENWKASGGGKDELGVGGEGLSRKGKVVTTSSPSPSHQKELAWLDKQLEKIEREKKRLEREMNKYLEREARLEKMKEALNNSPAAGCVVVRTPTAKCRVERITEKFAKKLYEWEEKRGVSVDESGFGLLHPKYFEQEAGVEVEVEDGVERTEREEEELEDDEDEDLDEVVGPLDLINARLQEPQEDESVRRAMEDVAEAMALADEMMSGVNQKKPQSTMTSAHHQDNNNDGRISSTASSCCCSEYEHTDSKHSNTDSEVYKLSSKRTVMRRVSSDTAGSGARSPSLSAFTSDEEEEDEEEQEEVTGRVQEEQHRDAESQTEVVVRAKQIVVEDCTWDENNDNEENSCSGNNPGVFVPTKRTIFAPVMDDGEGSHKVVIENGGGGINSSVASAGGILNIVSTSPPEDVDLDKPVVVGMVPKVTGGSGRTPYRPQPKTQFHRSFPNSKQVPVWCSPLVARKQFNNQDDHQQQSSSSRVPRKYTIGGGYMPPRGEHHHGYGTGSMCGSSALLHRSNSFGLRGHHGHQQSHSANNDQPLQPQSGSLLHASSVSKSKSTGSIKSRFKMFGGWFKGSSKGNSREKEDQQNHQHHHQQQVEPDLNGDGDAGSGGFSLRRIGSWVYKKGEGE